MTADTRAYLARLRATAEAAVLGFEAPHPVAQEFAKWFHPETALRLLTVVEAAEKALHEMRHTVAPRNSFTDVVDELDAALTALGGSDHG